MISSYSSERPESSGMINCTTASTFEKPNSLKFEILFGDYHSRVAPPDNDKNIVNAFDYTFAPNEIFGFSYASMGTDFKKLHHLFVLRACSPGEQGSIISGISPGAEILIKTLTNVGSVRLKSILQKLEKNKINLAKLSILHYRHINHLLEMKINTDFFCGRAHWAANSVLNQVGRPLP